MAKKKTLWEKLPKEVKVGFYVVGSAGLTALVDYLYTLEFNSLILAGIINIVAVSLQVRFPQIKARFKK